jgi:hypothetical protein
VRAAAEAADESVMTCQHAFVLIEQVLRTMQLPARPGPQKMRCGHISSIPIPSSQRHTLHHAQGHMLRLSTSSAGVSAATECGA